MNNVCLPPDDFEKLVMSKIENVDIDRKFSPFALAYFIFGCLSSLVIALIIEKNYINEFLKDWGLYSVIGEYYNSVLAFEDKFIRYADYNLILAFVFTALGICFLLYSLTFGVRKNE